MTEIEYKLLVDLHADALYRFMLKLSGDNQTASDLVQDSFVKLWQYVCDRDHEEIKNTKSFLFTLAYRQFIDAYRVKKKHEKYVEEKKNENKKEEAEACQGDISPETREVLQTAIKQLPESQRCVFVLRDMEGYSYAEISSISGLSEAQVKTYLFRARLFLKKYMVKIENLI